MEASQNKTVIVTGGAQGIGRQVTEDLLKKGYNVLAAELDQEAGKELINRFDNSSRLIFVPCDVSNESQVIHMVNIAVEKFGQIDALINNAAIFVKKPITELSSEEWNKVIATNLSGSFYCSKYAVPHLRKTKGVIINLSSTRAFMSEADTESYSASKGGIFSLTHAMAVSLGPDIRVNSISPGWIEVSDLKKESERTVPQHTEQDHSQHPAGRVGKPGDISSMIQFLLSPENSFITGQNFVVDGGMTRKMIYV